MGYKDRNSKIRTYRLLLGGILICFGVVLFVLLRRNDEITNLSDDRATTQVDRATTQDDRATTQDDKATTQGDGDHYTDEIVDRISEDTVEGFRKQSEPTLTDVMKRVMQNFYDKQIISEFASGDQIPMGDVIVLLAQSEESDYLLYGCVSPEFGEKGLFMNHRFDEIDHVTYLEEDWVNNDTSPQLYVKDYDSDGEKEIAIAFCNGAGTGIYVEKLIVLEEDEEGFMMGFPLWIEEQTKESESLLEAKVDVIDKSVMIYRKDNKQSMGEAISYFSKDDPYGKYVGMDYQSQIHYVIGDTIQVEIGVGVLQERIVTPFFADKPVVFTIDYKDVLGDEKYKLKVK